MNSGIYALYWWDYDLVYIGLSQDLRARNTEHFRLMRNSTHTNYKIQNTYAKSGYPEFIVVEFCKIAELPEKEKYWCNEFNALGPQGLCLVEPGVSGFGTSSNNSKYQKIQILMVFRLLYSTLLSNVQISHRVKVPVHIVNDIASGGSHLWLKDKYPNLYKRMYSNKYRKKTVVYSYISKMSQPVGLISPAGIYYEISTSIVDFINNNIDIFDTNTNIVSISRGLARVLDKTRQTYRGWKLA